MSIYINMGEHTMKTIKTIAFSAAIMLACSTMAFADGNAFTPLNFDDASYSGNSTSTTTMSSPAANAGKQELVGNSKMQNAILELDNAQVDVRNELLNYKAKYSDVDNQYTLIKSERKALHKQVKSIEKRIKQIDRAKEKIRKNML